MKFTFPLVLCFIFLCTQLLLAQERVEASKLQEKEGIHYYNDQPFTGEIYEMHSSDKKALTAQLKDGKLVGDLVRYYENGNRALLEEYDNGELVTRKRMDENGTIRADETFKNGKLDGEQLHFHPNGERSGRVFYKEGKREGAFQEFHENGQLKVKGTFKNDLAEGKLVRYSEDGNILADEIFKDGKRDGEQLQYHSNGNYSTRIFYREGKLDGPVQEFYENGRLKVEGSFKNEKRHGIWKWYDEKGKILEEEVYRNGLTEKEINKIKERERLKKERERKRVLRSNKKVAGSPLIDPRDGQRYNTVKIGLGEGQLWMAENLNYKTRGSYNNNVDTDNPKLFGRLYTRNAALKACPRGWTLPTVYHYAGLATEVNIAFMMDKDGNLTGSSDDVYLGNHLKSTNWWGPKYGGFDNFGFKAVPGGYAIVGKGSSRNNVNYYKIGKAALFWTSSLDDNRDGRLFLLEHNKATYSYLSNDSDKGRFLASVRCVKKSK